ncbi:MAG: Transcriptional regulator, AcrR family [uncultured Rubrobacteraceae bacterium]|uniref:Transcriptional regulator, AcrR family n=1 Tax=uncultured Rubrobacteraceae bacterium TaxID=349277 RepID=A0A6J4R1F2_9ACTN|nr:MAG: Transcriptional regulator, AcrR family [uncultured Rubrobacteraceae bacterium]
MGSETDRAVRRDALENRRRILEAAREAFAERGVDGTSMHRIGRAAGVGQGTLYRHFEHKGALCSALLSEEIEGFVQEMRRRTEGRGPALGRLKWFLGWVARFNEQNGPLLGAIRDASAGGRRVELYGNPFYERLKNTVLELLDEAVGGEEVSPDLDVECLSDTLLAALNIDLYLYQRHQLGMERERIVAAVRSVLEGLRVRE